jgi:C1A family cysteine protease
MRIASTGNNSPFLIRIRSPFLSSYTCACSSFFAFAKAVLAQETNAPYIFTDLINLEATPVISQGNTGTCWSFSTSSFLESEIERLTGEKVDLSEMYTVRNTYPIKSEKVGLIQIYELINGIDSPK